MRTIKINEKYIGDGLPCFIIAEAGSNHNNSLATAYKLIDIAAKSGADAVKFQNFVADRLYVKNSGSADYLADTRSIFDIIKSMEMPRSWVPKLAKYCFKKKIMFLSTPFDEESADILEPYVPCFKIASYEATHLPLIRHIAKKKKPIILSVGVTDIKEIAETINIIKKEGNSDIVLQQCISAYPAPCKSYNLKVIPALKKKFGLPVGVSDHTNNSEEDYAKNPLVIPLGAVALGANTIEKHFTLSRKLSGPDHKYAIEPEELNLLVRSVRDLESAMGDGVKKIEEVEKELYDFARRSVYSIKPIKKGSELTTKNIQVLRNGKNKPGLDPKHYESLLGRKTIRDIESCSSITLEDIL